MCSFMVTTVPSPIHNCVPKYPQDPTAYLFYIGNMATGKITACTDNIYSGHTALITAIFFMNLVYSGRWYFTLYSFFHAAAVLLAILLTRLHYTVDILIALFMTSFVWCVYHFLLIIYLDQALLLRQQPEAEDARILNERRLLLRLTNGRLITVLSWMDGMDLRLGTEPSTKIGILPSVDLYNVDPGSGVAFSPPQPPFPVAPGATKATPDVHSA